MKKFISLLVVLAMLMAIAPSAFSFGFGTVYSLELGENVAEFNVYYDEDYEEYIPQIVTYTWTAPGAGTLTIDFSDDDEATVWCDIIKESANGYDEYRINEMGGSLSIDVEADDVLSLEVSNDDFYVSAVFHFTASFEEAVVMDGSGTEDDPWIIESLEEAITGTFTSDEDVDHFYKYVAVEDGTLDVSAFEGCMVSVLVNTTYTDGGMASSLPTTITAGDVVLINLWGFAAGSYSATFTFETGAAEEGGETGGEEGGETGGEEGGEENITVALGDNVISVVGGSCAGGIYTAEADGTLTITIAEFMVYDSETGEYLTVDAATYFSRMGFYDLLVNDEDANTNVYTLEVVAGDVVSVYINAAMGSDAIANVNLALETAEEGGEVVSDPTSGTDVPVTADDPIIVVFTPEADGVLTVTVSSTAGWEVHFSGEDELDYRPQSDWATSPVSENLTAGVTYTITIHGYDEESWDYVDATITYDITFTPNEDDEGGETGGETGGEVTTGSLVLGENDLTVSGGEDWIPTDAEFTYVAEQDGPLYFSIRAFIMWGQNNIDYLFDPMYGVMDMYCAIYINGTMVEGKDTAVEVAQGDVVTVKLSSIDGSTYEIKLNVSYDGFYVPAPGSEENPMNLYYADCSTENYPVEIGAGEEIWYLLDYIDYDTYDYGPFFGATLMVYGENAYVAVQVNDMIWGSYTEYFYAENGVVSVPVEGELICIGNAGDTAATFELFAYIRLGSEMNPDQLVLGDNYLDLPEGIDYYYNWTAEEDGRLTITITGSDYWGFVVNDMTAYDYGEYQYFVYDDEGIYTLEVVAGNVYELFVFTQDPDWGAPGGSFVINASFEAGYAPGLPLVLGDNEMTDGRYEYVAEQTGTLYFCVTGLGYVNSWSGTATDVSDSIRNYYDNSFVLWVNDVMLAEFCGSVEVTEGDVVSVKWETYYGNYYGTVNLSYENNNPALGSEQRPVTLEYEDCPTTTVEIAPGEMAWYELGYSFYDATMIIKGENVVVQYSYYDYNAREYVTAVIEAENGEIVLTDVPSEMQIINNGTEAAVFDIEAYIPEGTSGNPADLVLGDNVTEFEVNDPDFYYEWIAPADGVLTLVVSGDFWYMSSRNATTYEYADTLFYYSDPLVDTWTFTVAAGDRIIVSVATCINWESPDWDGSYDAPAGTICVNASFTCAEHTVVVDDAVAPTCTETGLTEGCHCDVCGEVLVAQEVVAALGHDYVDGYCTVCGEKDNSVPPTGDMISVFIALAVVSGMALVALPKKKED